MFRFEFKDDGVSARLSTLTRGIPEVSKEALSEEADLTIVQALPRTPLETGALRGSFRKSEAQVERNTVSVTVEVGGDEAPYAIFVHENLDAYHPIGQAKFLEQTVRERGRTFPGRMAERINLSRIK